MYSKRILKRRQYTEPQQRNSKVMRLLRILVFQASYSQVPEKDRDIIVYQELGLSGTLMGTQKLGKRAFRHECIKKVILTENYRWFKFPLY